MTFDPCRATADDLDGAVVTHGTADRASRIEFIVDGQRRAVCEDTGVLLDSTRFWRGYRIEWIRMPARGALERVSFPHHRVLFVVGGSCDVCYSTSFDEARHRLSPGMFWFVSRGCRLERLAWQGARLELCIVDIADFGAAPNPVDAYGRTDAFFDIAIGIQDARVAAIIDLMHDEIAAGCPTGASYAEGLSVALASRVASLCATAPGGSRRNGLLNERQLKRVTDHIEQHISHELTIERLAGVINMSPFHFARCFKQATGMTPHQYVTRRRIERAREMVAAGVLAIGDIAMALGFSSQSHFADVYRKATGKSPRRDRTSR